MKKKVFALILAVVLAATCLVASVPVFAGAEDSATAIKGHNLALQDNVYIMYYVTFAGVPDGAETGVLVWTSEQENYIYGTEKAKALYDGTFEDYEVYYFTGVSARMMSQDIYAVSYIKDGDTITYSSLDKYSVLQYCYNKKDSTTIMGEGGTTLGELVAGLLDYGALAQTYFRYNLDRLANAEYYEIKVKGGTLADGTKSGLFQAGEQVTLSAPAEKDGVPFAGWKDETGTTVGTERNLLITVGANDKTYTAEYDVEVANPTFVVSNATASVGQTNVAVTVSLKKNPGISSIGLSISYDAGITLTNFTYNSNFGGQSTPYNANASTPKLVWVNWSENVDGDLVFATLYFSVDANASGKYNISITYDEDDVYNVNEDNISFDVVNGSITVQ